MGSAAPLMGGASPRKHRVGVLIAALAASALAALVYQTRRVESTSELYGKKDPFLQNFLGKTKNTGLSERKYVHSWVKQVKHGGLFNKLHTFEREHKQERKAWREKQLAGITEPSKNSLFNELMKTRSRAVGASTSRDGANRIQHRTDQEMGARDSHGKKNVVDFGVYRKHADAIAPKYAGKRTLPIVHHEIPKLDSRVSSLLHDLGDARPKRGAHMPQHAQLKNIVKAATSQLAALPGEEIAVEQEIASAKHAARNPSYRQAFAPSRREAGGRFRGGRIEENVEREIAAARAPSRHHLPFGRASGHGETLGTKPGAGLERELALARSAAHQDENLSRAKRQRLSASAAKREVSVEDAYSMPNGVRRHSS